MQSSSIKVVESCPKYISIFIKNNNEQLEKIYNEGLELAKKSDEKCEAGILLFNCSEKENIMNVQFANDEKMATILAEESVCSLKANIPLGKKLYFIFDMDRNDVFLVYI
jgi:hypothetical protein